MSIKWSYVFVLLVFKNNFPDTRKVSLSALRLIRLPGNGLMNACTEGLNPLVFLKMSKYNQKGYITELSNMRNESKHEPCNFIDTLRLKTNSLGWGWWCKRVVDIESYYVYWKIPYVHLFELNIFTWIFSCFIFRKIFDLLISCSSNTYVHFQHTNKILWFSFLTCK